MLKIKDRKYFPIGLQSRIYIYFLTLGPGGDGEEAAQEHGALPGREGARAEDRTQGRLAGSGEGRRAGGTGRPGLIIYIKLGPRPRSCRRPAGLPACPAGLLLWDGAGSVWSGREKTGIQHHLHRVWLLFQLRNFFFFFNF